MSDTVKIELVTDATTEAIGSVFSDAQAPVGPTERVKARLGSDRHHVNVHLNNLRSGSEFLSRQPDITVVIDFELSDSAPAVQGQQLAEVVVRLMERIDITEGAVRDLDFAHYLFWSSTRVVVNAQPAVVEWAIGAAIAGHLQSVGTQYTTEDLGLEYSPRAFFTAKGDAGKWRSLWSTDYELGTEYVGLLSNAAGQLGISSGITRRGYEDFLVDPGLLEQLMLGLVGVRSAEGHAQSGDVDLLARSVVLLERSGGAVDFVLGEVDGLSTAVREVEAEMRS